MTIALLEKRVFGMILIVDAYGYKDDIFEYDWVRSL